MPPVGGTACLNPRPVWITDLKRQILVCSTQHHGDLEGQDLMVPCHQIFEPHPRVDRIRRLDSERSMPVLMLPDGRDQRREIDVLTCVEPEEIGRMFRTAGSRPPARGFRQEVRVDHRLFFSSVRQELPCAPERVQSFDKVGDVRPDLVNPRSEVGEKRVGNCRHRIKAPGRVRRAELPVRHEVWLGGEACVYKSAGNHAVLHCGWCEHARPAAGDHGRVADHHDRMVERRRLTA
jgi:hypothetical protein